MGLSTNPGLGPGTTLTSPADALHSEEIERTKLFLRMGWVVAIAVAGATLVLPGDPRIARALLAVLGISVL